MIDQKRGAMLNLSFSIAQGMHSIDREAWDALADGAGTPLLSWGLALIAGGGLAGLISAGTAVTRMASTTTTAGLGNPIVATLETVGALLISLVAWFLPVVGLLLVALVVRTVYRIHRAKRSA